MSSELVRASGLLSEAVTYYLCINGKRCETPELCRGSMGHCPVCRITLAIEAVEIARAGVKPEKPPPKHGVSNLKFYTILALAIVALWLATFVTIYSALKYMGLK